MNSKFPTFELIFALLSKKPELTLRPENLSLSVTIFPTLMLILGIEFPPQNLWATKEPKKRWVIGFRKDSCCSSFTGRNEKLTAPKLSYPVSVSLLQNWWICCIKGDCRFPWDTAGLSLHTFESLWLIIVWLFSFTRF